MAGAASIAERLGSLAARLEAALAARDATIADLRVENARLSAAADGSYELGVTLAALQAELAAITADLDALRKAADAAEAAREQDFALRTEAAEALDRAIAELRSMAEAQETEGG